LQTTISTLATGSPLSGGTSLAATTAEDDIISAKITSVEAEFSIPSCSAVTPVTPARTCSAVSSVAACRTAASVAAVATITAIAAG